MLTTQAQFVFHLVATTVVAALPIVPGSVWEPASAETPVSRTTPDPAERDDQKQTRPLALSVPDFFPARVQITADAAGERNRVPVQCGAGSWQPDAESTLPYAVVTRYPRADDFAPACLRRPARQCPEARASQRARLIACLPHAPPALG